MCSADFDQSAFKKHGKAILWPRLTKELVDAGNKRLGHTEYLPLESALKVITIALNF